MSDKYRVSLGLWQEPWPAYFDNFYNHCQDIAVKGKYETITVCNYELKPYGKLIQTKTQGWYLRWDDERHHTLFVLKWS